MPKGKLRVTKPMPRSCNCGSELYCREHLTYGLADEKSGVKGMNVMGDRPRKCKTKGEQQQ